MHLRKLKWICRKLIFDFVMILLYQDLIGEHFINNYIRIMYHKSIMHTCIFLANKYIYRQSCMRTLFGLLVLNYMGNIHPQEIHGQMSTFMTCMHVYFCSLLCSSTGNWILTFPWKVLFGEMYFIDTVEDLCFKYFNFKV